MPRTLSAPAYATPNSAIINIQHGGTNATTAEQARINLGVAPASILDPVTGKVLLTALPPGITPGGGGSPSTVNDTTTTTSKTLDTAERCFVKAPGVTLQLPPTPSAGDEVIVVVGNFTDTRVAPNGNTILGLNEDLLIDRPNTVMTLGFYDTWIIMNSNQNMSAGAMLVTTTNADKTLVANERCEVTAPGVVLTLPATPEHGDEVEVAVGDFVNTVVLPNGTAIVGQALNESLIIDQANAVVRLVYFGSWRVV